ncbi:MAG TPA: zf-HC2 domain-containing protein [Planctomycetota bacterium]|nr:zf-HC2 domain-containing protein [Planctomycetota bacterium]
MDETRSSCPEEMKTQLSRYVDGELAPEEKARVDAHVAACVPCRELLDLFRRNETLLQSALTTDAFGDAVVASVVRSIRQEGPPVAAPVDEGIGEWLRARPLVPLAAAAAFLLGLVLLLNASSDRRLAELQRELVSVRDDSRRSSEEHRTLLRLTASNNLQYERALRNQRASDFLGNGRQVIDAFVEDRGLAVKASFGGLSFDHYEVWRQGPDDRTFEKLNREPLAQPEYVDRTAKPGRVYVYKIRAVKAGGESVYSAPIRLKGPADVSADQAVRVHCFDLAVTHDLGIFLLERKVDGRTLMEKFVVEVGQPIGKVVDVAGVGKVDFSTGLLLSRIEEGHQTLPLSYAEPVRDAEGKPVVERLENGRPVYVTKQHDVPLSIRPNLRAVFKRSSATGGEESVFKGSWFDVTR